MTLRRIMPNILAIVAGSVLTILSMLTMSTDLRPRAIAMASCACVFSFSVIVMPETGRIRMIAAALTAAMAAGIAVQVDPFSLGIERATFVMLGGCTIGSAIAMFPLELAAGCMPHGSTPAED